MIINVCVCASFDSKVPELSFHGGMFVALGGFSLRLLWLLHDSPSYFQRQNRRMCRERAIAGLSRESQGNLSP